ncbi:MAG TPA: hypothetical protein VFV99_05130 [Kofleriaceae bacterium]|nr:hypothetical protein [Kofleriaceae bacterium]
MTGTWGLALVLVLVLAPMVATAQTAPSGNQQQPAPANPPPANAPPADAPPANAPPANAPPSDAMPAEPAPQAPTAEELARRLEDNAEETDRELERNQREIKRLQRETVSLREKVITQSWLTRYINLFVDVGAFSVGGDGSGIRPDIGHLYYPEYVGKVPAVWVFMGDPLSTAINTNGEPSDTSTSREIERDTVNSEGRPSVMVNAVGLSIAREITDHTSVSALAEFLPRPDHSMLDIELATVKYRPLSEKNLEFELGKVQSVLGVEYRYQDATRRKGITPSLICRYTCGRPLGLRGQLNEGRLSVSASLTNGNNFQQLFEHDLELKSNSLPTASGHVQWTLPVGQGLEVGVSGAIGPQDGQDDSSVRQWHFGFDARVLDLENFDITAEYVQGKQPGKTESMTECDAAPCLRYKGGYLMVDRYVTQKFIPYVRLDVRSAVHIHGADFVYESHTFRTTMGAQFEITAKIFGKVEYTYNRELGRIPQFPDDVLTTSLVLKTD